MGAVRIAAVPQRQLRWSAASAARQQPVPLQRLFGFLLAFFVLLHSADSFQSNPSAAAAAMRRATLAAPFPAASAAAGPLFPCRRQGRGAPSPTRLRFMGSESGILGVGGPEVVRTRRSSSTTTSTRTINVPPFSPVALECSELLSCDRML